GPDFFDAARFQGENDFGEIQPLYLGQFLRGSLEMVALCPKPQAIARRRPASTPGPLLRGSAADFFDEQSVDSAIRVKRRNARQFISGQVPDGVVVATDRFRQVLDRNWKGTTARTQDRARSQVFLQEARIQSCGHDGEFQIETRRCLELKGASERDVAVEM